MAKQRPIHSQDPIDVGSAERIQRMEKGLCLLKTALSAIGPQAPQRKDSVQCRCHVSEFPLSVGAMLHCKMDDLTFKERAAWFSLSLALDIPQLPQEPMQFSVFPSQAHMQ